MVMLKIIIALSTFIAVTFSAPQSAYLGVRWFEIKTAKEIPIKSRDKAKTDFLKADKEWEKFKEKYGKTYESLTEEINRFDIFKSNLKFIIQHNTEYNNGTHSYFLGINRMADMDLNEFRKLNGYKRPINQSTEKKCSTYLSASNVILPDNVDWRKEGYVTPVKDQGNCGSCWAFSTTGSLEGQNYRKTKKLVSLSEQQLIDCSRKFGNEGCDGGWMDNSFEYIEYAGGIESEEEYPYKHRQGRCHAHRSDYVAEDTGCVDVESGSERQLQDAVANVGPVSVAIDASHMSFQLYDGGVYDEPKCSSELLDHGVLAVGYGTSDEGDDYWIVKNSWNKDWGMEGYILMSRNKENQCGIATEASYPLV